MTKLEQIRLGNKVFKFIRDFIALTFLLGSILTMVLVLQAVKDTNAKVSHNLELENKYNDCISSLVYELKENDRR